MVPRPIAWVSSEGPTGVVNLAPFSFFNAVASDPLYVIVSIGVRDDGAPKDTAKNIESRGEFAINMGRRIEDEYFGGGFPPDQSELTAVDLHGHRSAPRLAEAHVSLECKLFRSLPLGANTLYVGEVVMFHVAEHLLGPRLHINGFAPIGRLGSPSMYCRTTDRLEIARVSFAEWQEGISPGCFDAAHPHVRFLRRGPGLRIPSLTLICNT